MCGIAGMVRFDDRPVDPGRPGAMLEHMRHRGPDSDAIETCGRCTLVHSRLSVIDLPSGDQPMHAVAADGRGPLSVVYNGMIYNHRALRRTLEKAGHCFRSDHSDTEVLLHGFRQWGTDLPTRLQGFFAFAIWDAADRQLYLCRDRVGKKPLYIRRDSTEVTFASLIGTLVAGAGDAVQLRLDPRALICFLRLGYTFEASLLADIEELRPGHWMTVDSAGRTETKPYWRPPTCDHVVPRDQAVDGEHQIRAVLEQAVRDRLEADVPLGCFLSGGIDSSIVAALAQKELMAQGGDRLRTFSVAMPEHDFDESPYAHQVAQHIGSRHQELEAGSNQDVIGDFDRLIGIIGEPTADSSLLPTYWLSRATRSQVKVVLSGDGGDELFAGYDRYRAMRLLQRHRWWLRRIPPKMVLPNATRPYSPRTRLHRLVAAAQPDGPADQYRHLVNIFTDDQIRALGVTLGPSDRPGLADWPAFVDSSGAARRWDLQHYLPHDLMRKVDRASMAVGLEVRCPLLDTSVLELACRLPMPVLMSRGRPKGLLRQLAAQLLPATIAARPKRGFAIPIGRWFCQQLRDPLADHLRNGGLDGLGLHPPAIESLFVQHTKGQIDHTHRLFALLGLSLWWRRFTQITPKR